MRADDATADGYNKTAPVFILSNPRAGSTLLRYLLDTHPQICSPSELRLGAICEFLTVAMDLTIGASGNSMSDWQSNYFSEVRTMIESFMRKYCDARNKSRWCEKSPANTDHLDYLYAVFPDAQYICLHRHGLDVVKSELEMRRPDLVFGASDALPDTVATYIDSWCARTERLLAFESAHRTSTVRVRYEDLVVSPDDEMKRLFEFLDVPLDDVVQRVFDVQHDTGPGDYKIVGAEAIDADRIGQGLTLDISHTPQPTRRRMLGLLDSLGY